MIEHGIYDLLDCLVCGFRVGSGCEWGRDGKGIEFCGY